MESLGVDESAVRNHSRISRGDDSGDEKVCRICLGEDEPESMIAPCLCKGSSKWVHRSCLDLWRINEKDRAFTQCTECLFYYQFVERDDHRAKQFWRRLKFCLFVSRDICVVTIILQLIIALLGFISAKIDKKQRLVDWLDGGDISLCQADDNSKFLWCHHKLTVYYLVGFFALLVILGILGSIVLCSNGCKIPPKFGNADDAGFVSEEHRPATTTTRSAPLLPSPGSHARSGHGTHDRDSRTEYYRRHRQATRSYNAYGDNSNGCCGCCCHHHRSMYSPYYCYDPCPTPLFYGTPTPGSDGDCCCCCCDSPCCDDCDLCNGHSGGDGTCGDAAAIMIVILMVFLVIMAFIGFFVGVFLGVLMVQRVLQNHMFRLQKRHLADEFQVADLSGYENMENLHQQSAKESIYNAIPLAPPVFQPKSNLNPDDAAHLRKLGLLVDDGITV